MMQTEFLYPFRTNIQQPDLAWLWGLSIHVISCVVLVFFVPGYLAVSCSILAMISLRSIWDQQAIVRSSVALAASHAGQWYLESRSGGRDYVDLVSINLFAWFIIIKFKRFGGCSYFIQRRVLVADEQLHKMRLLSLYHN